MGCEDNTREYAQITGKQIKFFKVEKEADDSGEEFLCAGNSKLSAAQGCRNNFAGLRVFTFILAPVNEDQH